MANLIDYIVDLFRDDSKAQSFVNNPTQALNAAGLPNVTPEQVQAVAAAAAPAGVSLAGGDPMQSLQQAVAGFHSLPMQDVETGQSSDPISAGQSDGATNLDSLHSLAADGTESLAPTHDLAPAQVADAGFVSHDVPDLAAPSSVPDLASAPSAAASPGAGSGQFGGVNLDFGDITLGDKNTATGHAVANSGNTQGSIVSGDGAVLGDHNDVNNGAIHTGQGSNMNMGDNGVIHDSGTTAGGDVMTSGHGDVVKAAPGATTTVNDSSSESHTVFGNESDTNTNMSGAEVGGNVDASSHTDNSQHTDNSVHNTDSGNTDNSEHIDSHNTSDSHNNTVDTHLSASVPLF
jgi:hypothetical protein